jgi:hypothetical protein
MRKAISITLGTDNLLWLRAQAGVTARGSVSEVLDRLVSNARTSGHGEPRAVRSVVGTIDLPADDPDLERADLYIRSAFENSATRPMLVKESRPVPRNARQSATTKKKPRRG